MADVVTHHASSSPASMRELSDQECLVLLGTTTVGRIAYVDDICQRIVPVNFVVVDGTIYFRTAHDGLLAGLFSGHPDVAFEVDHHDDKYRQGWNVTMQGAARGVEDRATINLVLGDSRLRPWAGGVRPVVVAIDCTSVAGRRVAGG